MNAVFKGSGVVIAGDATLSLTLPKINIESYIYVDVFIYMYLELLS